MKFNEKKINNDDDWFEIAPPLGREKHWRDGKSAKELAKYIVGTKDNPKTGIPLEIKNILTDVMGIDTDLNWIPEKITRFDSNEFGKGEGRHHDLAIWNKDVFIGVEAKADESFDDKVSDWINAAKSDNAIANRTKRINAMSKLIIGRNYDGKDNAIGELRYQLFSALTGVIIEANNIGATKAGLLILTFKKNDKNGKPAWKQSNIDRNTADLDNFLNEAKSIKIDEETWKIALKNGDYSCKEVYIFHKTID